jgi:hypothetical protein
MLDIYDTFTVPNTRKPAAILGTKFLFATPKLYFGEKHAP